MVVEFSLVFTGSIDLADNGFGVLDGFELELLPFFINFL
jgi:hypothetical protein